MAPSPSAKSSLRSTGRATLKAALYGFVIAPLVLLIMLGVSLLFGGSFESWFLSLVVGASFFMLFCIIWFFVVKWNICEKAAATPLSPLGTATGYFLGCLCLAVAVLVSAALWEISVIVAVYGLSQGVAAFLGVRQGLRRAALGEKREGIGHCCANCFYDLSGTAEGLVCPECGGVMRYERGPTAEGPRLP